VSELVNTLLTDSAKEAARFIRSGGVVAFPTETVYGLGADVFNENAIEKIFEAKRRPADNPLIVHVSAVEQIARVAAEVGRNARKFIDAFFPGPLTVVLKKAGEVPPAATAGLDTVGIRMPRDKTARQFLTACDTPVAAPSANLSGRPSPTTWQAVYEDLNGRVDCILKGEATDIGLESTVVDCTGEVPILLRAGAVTLEELQRVVPATLVVSDKSSEPARSPGLRHQHYKPFANVKIVVADERVTDAERAAYIGIHDRAEDFKLKKLCSSVEEYARELFEFFRECDRREIGVVCCEEVQGEGLERALMDRLFRASAEDLN
jgi:L-threonylcarbamoyladenylate synthase